MNSSEEFKIGKNSIGYLGSSFEKNFLDMEFAASNTKLICKTLGKGMNDKEILSSLKPKEVMLGDLLYALSYLDKGFYIFYIRNKENILWAVVACWSECNGCWGVDASSVEDPYEWRADFQVCSRDFLDSSNTLSSESLNLSSFESRLKELEEFKKKVEKIIKL